MPIDHLYVLTGAPGSGKTAILDALGPGIATVAEPAREILAEWRAAGHTGQPEPQWMTDRLLERSLAEHRAGAAADGPHLFDRGLPDCAAYADWLGADGAAAREAAARHRYHARVLLTRPWPEIYTTDDERIMTYEMTVRFGEVIETAYREAGYELVEVRRGPLEERAAFVADFLTQSGGPSRRRSDT